MPRNGHRFRLPPLRLVTLALLGVVACPEAGVGQPSVPTLAEVAQGTIFEDRVEELLAGKTVVVRADDSDTREMGLGLACLRPPGWTHSLERFRSARAVMPDKFKDSEGIIDPADLEGSLASLRIGREREAKRYLDAKPGWELSLSSDEIAAFNALVPKKGEEIAAVEAQLRTIFAQRVRDYREKGLDGIAPFDRGSGNFSSAGEDLRNSTVAASSIAAGVPRAHALMLEFPGQAPTDGQEFYFWTRIQVLGRPVFLLNQRLAVDGADRSVVVERQFYATQFLSAGQTLAGLIRVQEGVAVFYTNRTFVDRWSGPGLATRAKRAVGVKIITDVLREMSRRKGLCD